MNKIDAFDELNMKDRLEKRGVSLKQGLSKEEIVHMLENIVIPVDKNIIAMYLEFDGFIEGENDSGSAISIWPLERVLEENRSVIALGKSRLSFADFLMNSNDLTCDFISSDFPVRYLDDPQDLAESFFSFCSKLVDGEYDF
jgi:hypothetical protein